MLRAVSVLLAASALAPAFSAHAIKVTLAGEVDFSAAVTDINLAASGVTGGASANGGADLNFDIVHAAGNGVELGGNIDLGMDQNFLAGTSTQSVVFDYADIYVEGDFGTFTLTTNGELSEAGSFLSVAEEVSGESGEFALLYSTPTFEGVTASVAIDPVEFDASASLAYSSELFDGAVDIEQQGNQDWLVDLQAGLSADAFSLDLYGAIGIDGSDIEGEAAAKAAYDFGTAEIHVGASTYLELQAGIEFEVQNLTLGATVSGMPTGVLPSTPSIVSATSAVAGDIDLSLFASFEYADHLTLDAEIETSRTGGVSTTDLSLGATLSF